MENKTDVLKFEAWFLVNSMGYNIVLAWLVALAQYAQQEFLAYFCQVYDHRWEDNGYAGPDSGCIHMDCIRCGASHHVTLY